MRAVIHYPVDADRAGAGPGRERRDHGLRLGDFLGRRREHLVDDRHLRRMDREPRGETVAARRFGLGAQACEVAEVDIDGLDRRHRGGGRAEQTERAREPIGLGELSVRVPVGLGAELGGQILRSPGQADEPGARAAERADLEYACRRLDCLGDDLDVAVVDAGRRLAHREAGVCLHDGGAALRLRQHDGVGTRRHHSIEIGVGKAGRERVDAHQQPGPHRPPGCLLHEGPRACPRRALAVGRDRVFEIDDHRVGAARKRLVQLAAAVGGNEEKGAHQCRLLTGFPDAI